MWLDRYAGKAGIPYPVTFVLMALFLYLLGFPFMALTGNLHSFLTEPRWVLVALFGALNGILIVFVYRKFSRALDSIEHLVDTEADFRKTKQKLMGYLTNRVYWVVVVFWLALNFVESPSSMRWWWFYNQSQIITAYELIETLPCCILGGIFMYMIPVGLNLAYRQLCFNTPFKRDALEDEWMKPFRDFRLLITFTMFGAVVYAIFPPTIWGSAGAVSTAYWVTFIPYTGITIVLVAVVLLPHLLFHRLFSRNKQVLLGDIEEEVRRSRTEGRKNTLKRVLLLLEKGETEKLKTWLLDVKTYAEIVFVLLLHVGLVELLSVVLHD
jgi:hypothetical protein